MILRNRILSGFEKNFSLGERRVCFAVNKMEGNVDNGEEGDKKEEVDDGLKFSLVPHGLEESFPVFGAHDEKGYLDREIDQKANFLKDYAYFVTGKNTELNIDLYEKRKEVNDKYNLINKEIRDKIKKLENKGDLDDLDKKYLKSLKEELEENKEFIENIEKDNKKEYGENLEKKFEKYVENFEENFKIFKEGEVEKINNKLSKVDKIGDDNNFDTKNYEFLSSERLKIDKQLKNLEDLEKNLFGEKGKMKFENFLKEVNEKIGSGDNNLYTRELDLLKNRNNKIVKIENRKSEEEIKNDAFANSLNKFFKDYFKDTNGDDLDTSYRSSETNSVLSKFDDDIELGKDIKTFEDCKEICDEIPGFENKVDGLFEGEGINFKEIDKILNLNENGDSKIKKSSEILKEVLEFNENQKVENKNNIFLTTKMYKGLKKISDDFYNMVSEEESISDFIKEEKLDKNNKEHRKIIKEKFDILIEKNGEKIEKINPENEALERADLEGFESIINTEIRSCKKALDTFKTNGGYIEKETRDSDGNIIEVLDVDGIIKNNYEQVNEFDDEFKIGISNLRKIKEDVDNTLDPVEKDYKNKIYQKKFNELKNKYGSDKSDNSLKKFSEKLAHKEGELNTKKTDREKFLKNEGSQPITLASIVFMIKEVYGEWKGGQDLDKEIAKNRAAGVMAKNIGESIGFADAVNKGNSLIRFGDEKMRGFYSDNVDKYKKFDKNQLKKELSIFAGRDDFNGTALYGVLDNMAEKGDFSPNNIDFLRALNTRTGFLGKKDKDIDEQIILDFINNKSNEEKNEILSRVVGEEFNDDDLYGRWTKQSIGAFNSGGQEADEKRDRLGDGYFEKMRDEYYKAAVADNLIDKYGCLKPGKTVSYPKTVNTAEYKQRMNNFVKMKITEGKRGFYNLIDAIAIGMIPPEMAKKGGIADDLANTFGWYDKFKKGLYSFEEIKDIKRELCKPLDKGGKVLEFDDFNIKDKAEQKKINNILDTRLGIWIKKESDGLANDTDKSFRQNPKKSKWWMETTAGKLYYKNFETHVLGVGTNTGIEDPEDLSGFINGIGFELQYFGKSEYVSDGKGGIVLKDGIVSNEEYVNIKETFKTFLAYDAAYIKESYTSGKGEAHFNTGRISAEYKDSKPEKFSGEINCTDNEGLKYKQTLKNQSNFFYEIFKEIDTRGGGGVVSNLEGSTNTYFGRGKGDYEKDVEKLFKSDNKDMIVGIIREFQKDKRFPKRVK